MIDIARISLSRASQAYEDRREYSGALNRRFVTNSLSVSSFAAEPLRQRSTSESISKRPRVDALRIPLSSRGTGDRETDERPPSGLRTLTNERLTDARSHPLLGRLLTSSCWTVHLTNPRTTRSRDCGTPGLGCLSIGPPSRFSISRARISVLATHRCYGLTFILRTCLAVAQVASDAGSRCPSCPQSTRGRDTARTA